MAQKDNKEAFLAAMKETFGNISESCQFVGIDRSLPYKWEKDDLEFAEKFRDSHFEEARLDMIEGGLTALAKEKNPIVLIFLAKTKGKKRGYIERNEWAPVDPDGNPLVLPSITVNVVKAVDQARPNDNG